MVLDLPTCTSCVPSISDNTKYPFVRQYMRCPSGGCACSGSTDSSCLYRIGAFYCEINTEEKVERITTITLNDNGKHV